MLLGHRGMWFVFLYKIIGQGHSSRGHICQWERCRKGSKKPETITGIHKLYKNKVCFSLFNVIPLKQNWTLLTKACSVPWWGKKKCWDEKWKEGRENLWIPTFNMNLPLFEPSAQWSVWEISQQRSPSFCPIEWLNQCANCLIHRGSFTGGSGMLE